MKNQGVDLTLGKDTDFVVGEVGGLEYKIVNPSGDWRKYLPTEERQKFRMFDSMGCVSFSALNCIETQMHYLLDGHIELGLKDWLTEQGFIGGEGHFNASDRFLAKMSNTSTRGNFPPRVWETISDYGLLPEKDYPSSDEFNRATYYAEIPQNLKDKASQFLKFFDIGYEWVANNREVPLASIQYHLKHAPLQTCSATCPPWGSGVIQACDDEITHATEVCGASSVIYDFDSYSPYLKQLALGYKLPYLMKGVITPKTFEITCEQARYCWNKFKEIREAFPASNGLISLEDPNYDLYDWCKRYGVYQHYDIFVENKMDWNGVEEILKAEDMPPRLEKKKNIFMILWEGLWELIIKIKL